MNIIPLSAWICLTSKKRSPAHKRPSYLSTTSWRPCVWPRRQFRCPTKVSGHTPRHEDHPHFYCFQRSTDFYSSVAWEPASGRWRWTVTLSPSSRPYSTSTPGWGPLSATTSTRSPKTRKLSKEFPKRSILRKESDLTWDLTSLDVWSLFLCLTLSWWVTMNSIKHFNWFLSPTRYWIELFIPEPSRWGFKYILFKMEEKREHLRQIDMEQVEGVGHSQTSHLLPGSPTDLSRQRSLCLICGKIEKTPGTGSFYKIMEETIPLITTAPGPGRQ